MDVAFDSHMLFPVLETSHLLAFILKNHLRGGNQSEAAHIGLLSTLRLVCLICVSTIVGNVESLGLLTREDLFPAPDAKSRERGSRGEVAESYSSSSP